MATGLPSVLLVMRKAAPYEDETHFSLNSRAECRVFLSKRILIDTPGIQSFTTIEKQRLEPTRSPTSSSSPSCLTSASSPSFF